MDMNTAEVDTLVFDVFGTVVGWRSTIIGAFEHLGRQKGVDADWVSLMDELKSASRPEIEAVNRGERPWVSAKVIYREKLESLLPAFGFNDFGETDWALLDRHWNAHEPWPDSVPGMTRLAARYLVSAFSNSDFRGMVEIGRRAGLPWNSVLTAEIVGKFKPDPAMYRMAIDLLGQGEASRIMLVATHNYDLAHGRAHGMRTAFIPRHGEYGPDHAHDLEPEQDWDIIAGSIEDLADRLGC